METKEPSGQPQLNLHPPVESSQALTSAIPPINPPSKDQLKFPQTVVRSTFSPVQKTAEKELLAPANNAPEKLKTNQEVSQLPPIPEKPKKLKTNDDNSAKILEKNEAVFYVDQMWGFLIFISIIYNFAVFFFYLGISGTPSGVSLVLEMFAELILLIDAMFVLYMYFLHYNALKVLPIDHLSSWCSNEKLALIIIIASSYPHHIVDTAIQLDHALLSTFPFAILRGIKILRYPEVWSYFSTQIRLVKGTLASQLKIVQYILNICMLIHAVAMVFLTLIRLESEGNWLDTYTLDKSSSLQIYTEFLLLITSNMGGMCYGDIPPVTVIEKVFYCLMVYLGATAFASLFGNLANSIYIANIRTIENMRKLEQIQHFASIRGLPFSLQTQLKVYYSTMHPNFSKYLTKKEARYDLLRQLPESLRTSLLFKQNLEFIQKVKLFQLSDIGFVMGLLKSMKPLICMTGDYIIRLGEIADSMYFIRKGTAKVVGSDTDGSVIAQLGEGSYFGEIGLLKEGKRTTSVVACTDCMLFSVDRDSLIQILEQFPNHRAFLEKIAEQRLETAIAKDNESTGRKQSSAMPTPLAILNKMIVDKNASPEAVREEEKELTETERRLPNWFEFSWGLLVLMSLLWNIGYTVFALCFDVNITEFKSCVIIDVLMLFVYAADLAYQIILSSLLYFSLYVIIQKRNNEYTIYGNASISFYTLFELLAPLPIDYLYFASAEYLNWLRLFRLLKIVRLPSLEGLIKTKFESYHMYNIIRLMFSFACISHVLTCLLFSIGKYEFENGGRYDSQCFFTTVPKWYSNFKPMLENTKDIQYLHCLYQIVSIMGTNIAGDVIPLSPFEQIFASLCTLIARISLSFLYAEVSNLISGYYSAFIEHVSKTQLIVDWLKYNKCNNKIIERVEKYRDLIWQKGKGIDDQFLINDMPETIKKKVQMQILHHLVQNADVIPKDDIGSVLSIIQRLAIKLYPQGEFILVEGEIAHEMYFLIEGIVDIYGSDGKKIVRLTTGKCFGEIALLKETTTTRMASGYCATNVSVAVFDKKDFDAICNLYPLFKRRVAETVQERERINKINAQKEQKRESRQPLQSSPKRSMARKSIVSVAVSSPTPTSGMILRKSTTAMVTIAENAKLTDEELLEEIKKEAHEVVPATDFIMMILRTIACLYNIYFNPLQMAFRMDYTPVTYTIESAIIALYVYDLVVWIRKYRKLTQSITPIDDKIEGEDIDFASREKNEMTLTEKKWYILKMIFFEIFTLIPWSMILQNVYYPTYVIFIIKMFRAMKIWPIRKLLSELKKKWPNVIRICEVMVMYTVFAHIMACTYIMMMYIQKTINESWVKLVHYPDEIMKGKFREGNDMGDVTPVDIYIHAIYFAYITLTHISIGDICATNHQERIIMCIYVVLSCHIYCFLFANITSMITDMSRGLLSNLQQKFDETMKCINTELLSSSLSKRIDAYFDFIWVDTRGIDERVISDLPIKLKSDIFLQIYRKAMKSSMLFRKLDGTFEKAAALSFLQLVQIRKYMNGDFVIKAGSSTDKIYYVLNGELQIIGINKEKLSVAEPGQMLNNRSKKQNSRQMSHVIATKISTVAAISKQDLLLFFEAYPHIADTYNLQVKLIKTKCKNSIPLVSTEKQSRYKEREKILEHEFTNATAEYYDEIVKISTGKVTDIVQVMLKSSTATQRTEEALKEEQDSDKDIIPIKTQKVEVTPSLFLLPNMKYYYLVYFAYLLNICVTTLVTPFHVAYIEHFDLGLSIIDALCILESVVHIIIRFRTAVEQKGMVYSYDFSEILRYYWETGLIVDLFGLCPFNLIFGIIGIENPLYVIIPLRYLRVIILANSFSVIGNLMLINFKAASTIYICTIFGSFIFLLHITSSFWYMISSRVESDQPITWEKYNKLVDSPLVNKVVMAVYYTTKIVAGVGSGESFAATHLERISTCVLIHIGDVLFAVTFGLIATFVSSWSTEIESYLIQKNELDDVADSLKLSDSQKKFMKEYYEYKQNPIYSIAVYQKSKELLPIALAKEVAYEMSKNLILPFFKEIASLNFIKRLAHKVETQYFLQNDFIVNRGTISEEMFIIVDGKATILEADKKTIYKQLEKNDYFGEIGLFYPCRRRYYVQADTHCCVCIIKKQTIDSLLEDFPLLKNSFKEFGERLILKTKPGRDRRKRGSLQSSKLVPPLHLENAQNMLESEHGLFRSPGTLRNYHGTQLEKESEEHPPKLIMTESKSHLSPHLESPENCDIARQSFANFNNPVIKIENLDPDKEEIKEVSTIQKKLCFDDVLQHTSLDNSELDKSPSNTVQLKMGTKKKDEPRLSQISFGKHLQLSEKTDVKMHWTLFEKPENTPNQ